MRKQFFDNGIPKDEPQKEPEQARGPGHCSAFGCKEFGSFSDSINGGGSFYCWLHHGKEHGEFDAITSVMRRNEKLLRMENRLRVMSYADWVDGGYSRVRDYLTANFPILVDADDFARGRSAVLGRVRAHIRSLMDAPVRISQIVSREEEFS